MFLLLVLFYYILHGGIRLRSNGRQGHSSGRLNRGSKIWENETDSLQHYTQHPAQDLNHRVHSNSGNNSLSYTDKVSLTVSITEKHDESSIESTVPRQTSALKRVVKNIARCLEATNMKQSANETKAIENAQYLYLEYTRVIPETFLTNYSSHCWNMHYDVAVDNFETFHGHMGNLPFKGGLQTGAKALVVPINSLTFSYKGSFSSEIVCLPKVFMAGFGKCGSSYLWCFLQSLVRLSSNISTSTRFDFGKEAHFWVKGAATAMKFTNMPNAGDIGSYLLNYLPGLKQLSSGAMSKRMILMDGTPNIGFNWPRYKQDQPDSTNYCLIPAALPELLPKSKFVFVMRNPLLMLYSAFWYSCTLIGPGVRMPYETQLKGPSLFHKRVKEKIDIFINCMQDANTDGIDTPCSLVDGSYYGVCILQRLHLLDKCVHKISFRLYGDELSNCGRSRLEIALYYTHIRKWLSVVPKDRILFLTLEELVKSPTKVAEKFLVFFGFADSEVKKALGLTRHIAGSCSQNSQDIFDYKHDPKLKMRNDTRTLLETFLNPFNLKLAEILHDDMFLWDDN